MGLYLGATVVTLIEIIIWVFEGCAKALFLRAKITPIPEKLKKKKQYKSADRRINPNSIFEYGESCPEIRRKLSSDMSNGRPDKLPKF